jgi:uncharacterized protein YecE (DUF72 family)
MRSHPVRVGCAGWSIPKEHAGRFPEEGSHLERYARRYPAVEINSSFYRPHRPATYARWAAETPDDFAFAVKVPKEITHKRRLVEAGEPLARFLDETSALGSKRGPLLVQLPPSLTFKAGVVSTFFSDLRSRFDGGLVCEPRHTSWFAPEPEQLLARFEMARVAADPAVQPQAAEPGGWGGLVYYRLHGSPEIYYSTYSDAAIDTLARTLRKAAAAAPTWCIFDNTALGAATDNALALWTRLRAPGGSGD